MKLKLAVLGAAMLLMAQVGSGQGTGAPPGGPGASGPPGGFGPGGPGGFGGPGGPAGPGGPGGPGGGPGGPGGPGGGGFAFFSTVIPENLPPPSPDPRNLEGTYLHMSMLRRTSVAETLPYKPEIKAKIKEREDATRAGKQYGTLFDLCRQGGIITEMSLNFPFKIVQSKKEIFILHEEMHSRIRIFMDRPMPKNPPVSYEGYSVGHWDGDTLVVETRGIDPRTNLGLDYAPHTAALKQTLRIRKLNGGKSLEFAFVFDDPEMLIKPYSPAPIVVTWRPDQGDFAEYDCEETTGTAAEAARYGVEVAK